MFSTLGMIQGRANRIEVLRQARRIVKPGGSFLLHVHHRYAALTEPGGWRRLIADRFRSWTTPDFEFGDRVYAYRGLADMFLHRFSLRELRRDFAQAGWEIDDVMRLSLDGTHLIPPRSSGFRTITDFREIAGGFFVCAK